MRSKIADLHIHSFYSDGTMSPEEILVEASSKNVGLLAITDHDLIDGSAELLKLKDKYDIRCISGVEIHAVDNGVTYHILGYGIDIQNKELNKLLKQNRALLEEFNSGLIEKMQDDYEGVTLSDYGIYNYDKKNGGWKALNYFVEKGLTKSLQEGFEMYAKYSHSYESMKFPSINQVCKCIHNAGGKAVLAHPGNMIDQENVDKFENEVLGIISLGIDGIECYYPLHSEKITNACIDICKDRDLLITCGSDCHGEFEDTEIGEMDISIEKLNLGDLGL